MRMNFPIKSLDCAIEVHQILGPGLLESAYKETSVIIDLDKAGLTCLNGKYQCLWFIKM